MIKRLLILAAFIGATFVVMPVALAQNRAEGEGGLRIGPPCDALPGALGTCFVPLYSAVGGVAVYKAGVGATTAQAADCCVAGDTYRFTLKNTQTGVLRHITFTSGTGNSLLCVGGPHPGHVTLNVAGADKIKLKAVALPGGIPASAYVDVDGSGWTQTKGTDSCGF